MPRCSFGGSYRAWDRGINSTKGEGQARGKLEKWFDYFPRRLPFVCEKYRVCAFREINRSLSEEVAYYNERREHLELGEIPSA
jgi:transposase InsO family protein